MPNTAGRLLAEADPNHLAVVRDLVRRRPAPHARHAGSERIMVIGFSMGASLGLWLSEREPDDVSAVVGFYGTQGIDFTRTPVRATSSTWPRTTP